ncbi:protein O-mannosyl-transferase 2-like [Portunus trituberculatus]|uniref:protein O-mannosyl-transferase 2-like n=1 Tax=Portunus trituberculatus TaxID=210409 RepID=UPI001E1CF81B|nr:protein O-mannosyl-transferase 2-like [Portunus trituberculatus]
MEREQMEGDEEGERSEELKEDKEAASTTTIEQTEGEEMGVGEVCGRAWWGCLLLLTLLAVSTRQMSLEQPPGTLWDEVHFGTFTNHYLNHSLYHDVHPPLGKMAVAGLAWLAGYDGAFEFKVGTLYPEGVNFVAMRSMMALFGASLVPLTFLIVWEVSSCLPAACLAALCVLCDTFMHRLNTLLLLDPLLLSALLASVFGSFKFHAHRHRAWSRAWWGWMTYTAFCLGVVVSIKYVGVFTVGVVGVQTAYHLVSLAFNPRRPLWVVLPHTAVRAVVFVSVSSVVYLSSFLLHFLLLTKASVNGGGLCHTEFYASFEGNEYEKATFPEHVHYGANITIQNSRPLCGYLESWYDLFPASVTAPCQQVTSATVRDDELLMWTIKKVNLTEGSVLDGAGDGEAVLVRSGDHVMLTHAATGRSLRSHGHRAPVTRRQLQVCGYGDDGVGGPFETWQLLVVGAPVGTPLSAVRHSFLLRHYKMECYLRANEMVKLPEEWAFNGAKEVTCTRNKDETGLHWHVNWNNSPKLGVGVPVRSLGVGLWGKIVHQHFNMFIGNAVLVETKDEERHARPWMWPILWQMQTLGSYVVNETSGEEHFAVGMTNPFITYLNLLCLAATPLLALTHAFYSKRRPGQCPAAVEDRRGVLAACGWLGLCWAGHYLPFFFMSRVLYYHHYCPSYLFSCMITGVIISWACRSVTRRWQYKGREKVHLFLLTACGASVVASYVAFFPIATYIKGVQFEENPRLNPYLDYLYAGQLWPEFGYRMDEYVSFTSTVIGSWNQSNFANTDLNATLYFSTPLNYTVEDRPAISPVPASSYDLWASRATL